MTEERKPASTSHTRTSHVLNRVAPPTLPLGPLSFCVAEASAQPGWTTPFPGAEGFPGALWFRHRWRFQRVKDAVPRQLLPDFRCFHVNPQMLILVLCGFVSPRSGARDKGLVCLGGDPRKQERGAVGEGDREGGKAARNVCYRGCHCGQQGPVYRMPSRTFHPKDEKLAFVYWLSCSTG